MLGKKCSLSATSKFTTDEVKTVSFAGESSNGTSGDRSIETLALPYEEGEESTTVLVPDYDGNPKLGKLRFLTERLNIPDCCEIAILNLFEQFHFRCTAPLLYEKR